MRQYASAKRRGPDRCIRTPSRGGIAIDAIAAAALVLSESGTDDQ